MKLRDDEGNPTLAGWIATLTAAVVLTAAALIYSVPARAEGVSPPIPGIASIVNPPAGSWSGLGVSAYGSWVNADTDTAPSMGLTGYTGGGAITASLQMGQVVVEVGGEYGWVFGDLQDLGVNNEMALVGRLGFLVNPSTLLYTVGTKSWIDTDFGTVDGWQYGVGTQFKFGNSGWYGSLEYRHGEYDTADIICVDAVTDTVRAALTYKFGGK